MRTANRLPQWCRLGDVRRCVARARRGLELDRRHSRDRGAPGSIPQDYDLEGRYAAASANRGRLVARGKRVRRWFGITAAGLNAIGQLAWRSMQARACASLDEPVVMHTEGDG